MYARVKKKMSKRIVFMGTPAFAVPALKALHAHGHTLVAVFTQPDSPAGRGRKMTAPPVKLAALELGLPVLQPSSLSSQAVLRSLLAQSIDVIVVAAYAKLLPVSILGVPRLGCKNIHASLLPKYRGGAPVHWAVVNGERETGVTIMEMARGLDTGDIIARQAIPIGEEETCGSMTDKLAGLGAELVSWVVALPDAGESRRVAQDHALMSFARNVSKQDGLIDWSQEPRQVHDRVRGMYPWPGAFTHWQGTILRILGTRVVEQAPVLPSGVVSHVNGRLWVGCRDASLELLTVQPPGRKAMSALDFHRGYLSQRGDTKTFC